jgi:hypothetical protein
MSARYALTPGLSDPRWFQLFEGRKVLVAAKVQSLAICGSCA